LAELLLSVVSRHRPPFGLRDGRFDFTSHRCASVPLRSESGGNRGWFRISVLVSAPIAGDRPFGQHRVEPIVECAALLTDSTFPGDLDRRGPHSPAGGGTDWTIIGPDHYFGGRQRFRPVAEGESSGRHAASDLVRGSASRRVVNTPTSGRGVRRTTAMLGRPGRYSAA
jgi:hypothetical protein